MTKKQENFQKAINSCSRAISVYKHVQKLRDESEERGDDCFDDDYHIDSEYEAIATILKHIETLIRAAQHPSVPREVVDALEFYAAGDKYTNDATALTAMQYDGGRIAWQALALLKERV